MKRKYSVAAGIMLITWLWTFSAFCQDGPKTPKDFNNLGVADHNAGQYQEAVQNYSRAVRIDPGYAKGYFNRGVAYQALNKNELMCQDFRKACELGECDGVAWAKQNGLCREMDIAAPAAIPSAAVSTPPAATVSTPPAEPPKPARKLPKKRQPPRSKKIRPAQQQSEPPGLMVIGIAAAVTVLLVILPLWIVYRKAGQPGWGCLVPIYNIILMLRIAGKPWWWLILMLIPVVGIIFLFLTYLGIAKNFGKGLVFALGLFLLPIIFFPILAFTKARYQG